MRRTSRGGALAVIGALLLTPVVSLISSTVAALAVGPQPPTDTSFYVMTTNAASFYTWGYNQGYADHANGNVNSEVILDFGGQSYDGSGTIKPKTMNVYYSWATVETIAEQFGEGYYYGTGSDLTSVLLLDVGTNNSAYHVDSAGGATFAGHVQNVSNWMASNGFSSQVFVEGANDMEPGYDTYPPTAAWISGWAGAVSLYVVNFGSADGCPQTTHSNGICNNGWTQDNVWYLSWGAPPSYATPEIYIQSQANQWGQIRYWKYMLFRGPLDEYPLNTGTFNSSQAWAVLWDASGGVGQYYSLEITNST